MITREYFLYEFRSVLHKQAGMLSGSNPEVGDGVMNFPNRAWHPGPLVGAVWR